MAQLVAFHYQPGTSALHRLDARIALALLLLMVAAVLHSGPAGLAFVTVLASGSFLSARLAVRRIARDFRLFAILLGLMFIARAFGSEAQPFRSADWLGRLALVPACLLVWRLALLVLLGTLFSATTRAAHVQSAVAWYLKPFRFLPGARIAVMVGLTLSLIPLIFDSYREISDAQAARGAHGFRRPVKRLRQLVIPLMLKTFGRADAIAEAMESRCYSDRRSFPALRIRRFDWLIAAAGAVAAVLAILLDRVV